MLAISIYMSRLYAHRRGKKAKKKNRRSANRSKHAREQLANFNSAQVRTDDNIYTHRQSPLYTRTRTCMICRYLAFLLHSHSHYNTVFVNTIYICWVGRDKLDPMHKQQSNKNESKLSCFSSIYSVAS